MVNEKLLWNAENQGWYYNPLKYWPNETDQDSQDTPAKMEGQPTSTKYHLDRLTFFAYAPYVSAGVAGNPGITGITNNLGKLVGGADAVVEPTISYQAAINDPNASVDLLWGVAPAGGLTYTAVNGRTVNVDEGMPLLDMTKPDINTSMKFLFNHALARIGIKAVAAVDQVGAGGKLDPNTKITINKITLTGYFGTTGELNLDNEVANKAKWVKLNGVALSTNPATGGLTKTTLTLNRDAIAEHLRWVDSDQSYDAANPEAQTDRIGVTTVKQNVIDPSKPNTTTKLWSSYKEYAAAATFPYSESTPYYLNDPTCVTKATATITAPTGTNHLYTVNANGVYTQVAVPASVTYPEVNKWFVGEMYEVKAADATAHTYDTYQAYTKSGTPSTASDNDTFTPLAVGKVPAAGDWVIKTAMEKSEINYVSPAANTKYYTRDANYFMVVPNKWFENSSAISASADEIKALRTVRVMIEYYITTEDGKLSKGRTQTKNVIEKDVVFPSIENGKSYNLNLILGLTSVKMEAEVDDWKVVNVQGDLPQNTAGE